MTCAECDRPVKALGLCARHYLKAWRQEHPGYHRVRMAEYRWASRLCELAESGSVVIHAETDIPKALSSPLGFVVMERPCSVLPTSTQMASST